MILQASTARTLLRHYIWNSEKLQEQFWNDPALALLEAGLSPQSSPSARNTPLPSASGSSSSPRRATRATLNPPGSSIKRTRSTASSTPFECPICCEEFSHDKLEEKTLALGCGHRFCCECWNEYLNGKIKGEGESAKIQCMESGCKRIVREDIVDKQVSEAMSQRYVRTSIGQACSSRQRRYHNLLNVAYVADSPMLRWCPHNGCEYIIECSQALPRMLNQIVPIIHCKCGQDLCFGYGTRFRIEVWLI